MDLNIAITIALSQLKSIQDDDYPLQLLPEETIERPYGWFFFYNSKEFIETNDYDFAIAGNAPILVTKNGDILPTGTAYSIEHYIKEYDDLFINNKTH